MKKIKPIIMAGGVGSRLWPLSRRLYPKQFIKIFNGLSLLQNTLINNKPFGKATVIVNEEHQFIAQQQIEKLKIEADLIIEPAGKNTAACAILGSLHAKNNGFDNVLLLPCDLYISNDEAYHNTIFKALKYAKFSIVTIGIKPTFAHTGYGYIEKAEIIDDEVYKVKKFVEKPNLAIAKNYIHQGGFCWNSGIFICDTSYILEQAEQLHKLMLEATQKAYNYSTKNLNFIKLCKDNYDKFAEISFEYAFMERSNNLKLIEGNFCWKDLGSWNSLWEAGDKDASNNHIIGDVIASKVTNSYIRSEGKLTAVLGLDNIIVINTGDAVLVANKSKSEQVKNVIKQLAKEGRSEATQHLKILRPWGCFQTIDDGNSYKVKRIVVRPGQNLSLQYHLHRAEHWVIVQGIAEVIVGRKTNRLFENDSIYIPKGMKHRLTNIGEIDLHLIEVQTGSYLNEEDIKRLADSYGRV